MSTNYVNPAPSYIPTNNNQLGTLFICQILTPHILAYPYELIRNLIAPSKFIPLILAIYLFTIMKQKVQETKRKKLNNLLFTNSKCNNSRVIPGEVVFLASFKIPVIPLR